MPRLFSILVLPFAVVPASGAFAEDAPATAKSAEYKRADANFYPRGDILKYHPSATILPEAKLTQKDGSYFFTPKAKPPKEIYTEVMTDWIEPITPPDMPPSLNIDPDAMQVREPQGDVTVAMPAAPGKFVPVTDGMGLPNGAVIKTGANSTAAILFGGVDSARLMPNSEAAVQQTVTPKSRSAEVDLTSGGVFSKVGTQIGVKGDYTVHTKFGNAFAHGTDFITLTTADRTDVWIALGTVELVGPDAKRGETATVETIGGLKLLRLPAMNDPKQSFATDSDAFTAILNFIPMANQKIAALRAQVTRGTTLSGSQQDYLNRLKQVPALIKLAYVEPPPPPPKPIAIAPAQLAPIPPPTPPVPATVTLNSNGTIRFQGATLGLAEFQAKVKEMVAAKPDQALIIKASPKAAYAKFKEVMDVCSTEQVKTVTIASAPVVPPPVAETPPPVPPATVPETAPAVVTVTLNAGGSIRFQGETLDLAEFQTKLKALVVAKPEQAIAIKASPKVAFARFTEVMDACKNAQVKSVAVVSGPTAPPPAPAPRTAETPPTPAPVPTAETPPAPPALLTLDADNKLTWDSAPVTDDEFKTKLTDLAKTEPKVPLQLTKDDDVKKSQWQKIVDVVHDAKLKVLLKTVPAPKKVAKPTPPKPAPPRTAETPPVTAETPPTPPAPAVKPPEPPAPPVEAGPPPAVIGLKASGKTFIDRAPVTEDELKAKLADIAKTNPTQPLVLVKTENVTREQWQKIAALCHDANLKVHVLNTKEYHASASAFPPEEPPKPKVGPAPSPMPVPPPVTAETPPGPPAPEPAPVAPKTLETASIETAPPAVIGLDSDGKTTWDGEAATEDDLKAKLADLAKTEPKQPLLMLKTANVTREQWQKIVTLVHTEKLKVRVVNDKEYHPDAATKATKVEPPPADATAAAPGEMPAPHLAAKPAPQKSLPVEINLKPDGKMTLDGNVVTIDQLKARLSDLAQVNPQQPVLLVRTEKIGHDKVTEIVDLCHEAKLKVKIKTEKTFTPAIPATTAAPEPPSSPAPNLPAPSVHMRPSVRTPADNAPAPGSP